MEKKQNREEYLEKRLKAVFPDYDERKERVLKTEWQRWTPILSLYRVIADPVKDRAVRGSLHTQNYLTANIIFDLAQITGLGVLFYELPKLIR